ncbi:MAG: hypothetical protein ACR2NN_28475 [Bryobacteraceae bacterium]
MEPSLDFIHIEIETGLILVRMASIVHEKELFTCAERIRTLAGKAHKRAAQHLEKLPPHILSDIDREALLTRIKQLRESVGERASGGSA